MTQINKHNRKKKNETKKITKKKKRKNKTIIRHIIYIGPEQADIHIHTYIYAMNEKCYCYRMAEMIN